MLNDDDSGPKTILLSAEITNFTIITYFKKLFMCVP